MAPSLLVAALTAAALDYQFVQLDNQELLDKPVLVKFQGWSLGASDRFALVRLEVRNDADSAVRLELSVATELARASRRVEIPTRSARVVFIPMPPDTASGELRVEREGATPKGMQIAPRSRGNPRILALGDPERFEELLKTRPAYNNPTVDVETLSAAALPSELAALAGYDAIILLEAPIEMLPEPARRVLENYAATGGALVLAKATRASSDHLPLTGSAKEGVHPYAYGSVRFCYKDAERCAAGLAGDAVKRGAPIDPEGPSVGNAAPTSSTLLPLRGVPVGAFVAIIAMFAMCVGPGSFWVARKIHLAALVLSIPATAMLTSFALVGFSVLRDGLRTRAATCGYTVLDRSGNRAIQATVGGFFGPFAASGARVDLATALVFGASPRLSLDWDRGASLGDDFLPARTYREWGFITVAPSRARLVVATNATAGAPLIQNALGGAIREVRLRRDGLVWGAQNIPEGGEAVAHAVDTGRVKWIDGVCAPRLAERADLATAGLADGEFIAVLDQPAPVPVSGFTPVLESGGQIVRGEVSR